MSEDVTVAELAFELRCFYEVDRPHGRSPLVLHDTGHLGDGLTFASQDQIK